MSLDLNNNIYSNIASQFPSIYREEGSFLVDFIEAYYQHLDAKMDRDIPKLKDIDTTLTTFLIYYKKKYLSDLPIDTVVDTRFIVKHITDIYKRKGTQEALELVFRLFFDEDIEVFYPSGSILRPSDSIFGGDAYLEMYPVFTSDGYPVKKGDKLVGSVSLASAFVDEILFVNFSGSLCPIVYLSNLSGSFTSDDSLTRTRDTVSTIIGKLVRGSVSNVAINNLGRLPNQKVGDKIKISSSAGGIGASGLVTEISTAETGTISFSVVDGGFGYADPLTSSASNSIGISNQVLIVGGTVTQNIKIGDIVTTYKQNILNNDSSVAVASGMTGSAVVIAYAHPLLYVKTQATSLSAADTNNRITQLNKSYTSGVGIGSNILKTELARIVGVDKPLLPEVENAYTKTVSIQNDFDSSTTIVAASTDQITIPLHGFVDQGTVTYTATGTGTALSPLVSGTSYFVKVNSDNTVSLYNSLANADSGGSTGRQNFTTTTINNATGSHRLTGTRIVGDLAAAGSINAAAIGVLDAYFLYVENASYPSDNAGVLGSLTATQKKYLETIALPELGIFDQFTTLSTAQKSSFVVNHSSDEITFNSTSNYNVSASYTIGSIKDSETVTLIIDQVGDFAGVVLNQVPTSGGNDGFGDDDDYGMSGDGSESLGTTLRDAFTPITLTIGSIDSLITKQGLNYTNDVFSNIENSTILKFDKRDIVFSFDPNQISSLLFSVGDLVTQEIQLENILNVDITTIIVQKSGVGDSYPSVPTLSQSGGNTIPYTAKAKFLKRAGNNFYFRQMSFYDFDESIDAKTEGGATIGITAIARDPDSRPMGGNATIQGEATYSTGQISKVKVENTGYKFADREIVDIINDELVSASYGTVVAKATVRSLGTGKTEGAWKSSTSFLSDSTKRLADNDYYQEYSYDISSSVEKNRYSGLIKEVAGVAGTKLFSSSLVGSTESLDIDIDSAMDAFYSKTFIFEQQDSPVVLSTPLSTVNFTNSTGTISFAAYDISASFRLAVTGATNDASITGYTGATISNVQVSGTAGEFTCDAATLVVGQVIRITETGTLSGTGDISGGTGIYRVNAVSGSAGSVTEFTLGIISIVDYTRITPIGSVAGTTTGLTFESGELYTTSSVTGGTEGLRTGLTLKTLADGAVATSTNSNSQLDITPISTLQDLLMASSTGTPLTTVVIGGTTGQFTCDAAALAVGQKIAISGTYGGTGSITGYSNPTTYIITAITGTSPSITGFTLKTTSGVALTTSTGTPNGLTYTPLVDDVYMGGIVNIPNTSTKNRELSFTELSSAYEVDVSDEASRSTRISASSNGVASVLYDPATAHTSFSSDFDVSNGYNSIVGYTDFNSANDPGTFEDRVDIDFTSHGDRKNWIGYDTLSINVSTRDSTPGWEFSIEVTDGTTTLASPFVDLPAYVSTNPEYIKTATLDMKNTLINRSSITKVTLVFRGTLPVNGTDTDEFLWRVWSEGSPVTGDIPAYINSVS